MPIKTIQVEMTPEQMAIVNSALVQYADQVRADQSPPEFIEEVEALRDMSSADEIAQVEDGVIHGWCW